MHAFFILFIFIFLFLFRILQERAQWVLADDGIDFGMTDSRGSRGSENRHTKIGDFMLKR